MIELIQARFIGLDGSIGYRYGQTYSLIVETSPHGPEVVIKMSDSGSGRCPYDNALAFLRNWDNIRFGTESAEAAPSPGEIAALAAVDPALAAARYFDSKGKEHDLTELTEPHLLNIARKDWRLRRNDPVVAAEMERRGLNIKEHLTSKDLE